jgi:beta-lactamase class C
MLSRMIQLVMPRGRGLKDWTLRLLTLLISALVIALSPASASAQLKKDAQALRNFAEELDEAAKAPDFVGLAVAVVKKGEVALMRTYGVREAGGSQKVTPDTVFRLASLSKGFASTLAVLEQSEGKLDLKTPVVSLVPEFRLRRPGDAARVTFEDVLAHRTGLPPYAYDNLLEAGTSPKQILSKYGSVKQTCAPGECFTYQNVAFNMIAAQIEKATGKSFATELRDRIFLPLGMTTASTTLQDLSATGNWARPHRRVENTWMPVPVTDYYYKVPAAGGVNASISDLSKWLIAQMGHRPDVLPRSVLDEAHRRRIATPPETARQRSLKTPVTDTSYGLGWRRYTYAGEQLLTHSGSVEGYIAQIAWLPTQDAGIVILSNTRGSRAAKILPTWLDYQLGLEKTDWFRLTEIPQAAGAPATAGGD